MISKETHACFKVKLDGKVAYFDPYKIKEPEKADIILITHEHYDHLSLEDIKKIIKDDSTVVIPPVAHPDLLDIGMDINNLVVIGPGEVYRGEGFEVETVPAYNINKDFHPKQDSRIGFILTLGGKRIYHAGDTDVIPEMSSFKNIDVALLPVSGKYVMTAEEAAKAVDTIKPKKAIPMHWGDIIGTREDAEKFKSLAKTEVEIL